MELLPKSIVSWCAPAASLSLDVSAHYSDEWSYFDLLWLKMLTSILILLKVLEIKIYRHISISCLILLRFRNLHFSGSSFCFEARFSLFYHYLSLENNEYKCCYLLTLSYFHSFLLYYDRNSKNFYNLLLLLNFFLLMITSH